MTGNENDPEIDGGLAFEEETFPKVINIIDVENIDEIIKRIEKNCGEIIQSKHVVPRIGWLVYFKYTECVIAGVMRKDLNAK